MTKERLDILLVKRGFFESREKARSAIMAGAVLVYGQREDKPGSKFPEDCEITLKNNINPYVSRGGLKLEKAVKAFNLKLEGLTAMDIGASTGGFTDCMLKNGAAKVYAVDVGYGQLAWSLRNDERVVNMERTNIRYVEPDMIEDKLDFSSVDVSFISLKKVLPVAWKLLKDTGEMVCLVKPQFEAGREKVGKHGVVRDKETHIEVIEGIMNYAKSIGFYIKGLTYSPVKGPEGNIEYLLYISKSINGQDELPEIDSAQVVDEAHAELNK